jgi:hypothetical protein
LLLRLMLLLHRRHRIYLRPELQVPVQAQRALPQVQVPQQVRPDYTAEHKRGC